MKILLAHKFWRKVGGAEMYFQDTARILRSKGHQVKIYTTDIDVSDSNDVFKRDENVIFGHYVDYLKGSFLKKLKNIPATIYSRKNKEEFSLLLKEFQPDVVHVFAIYVTITPSILDACREAGIPVVMSCNDYKHICPNYRLFHHGKICEDCKGGKFYNAVLNNCCKHSLAVSAVSALEAYVHSWKDIWKKNISAFLFESRFMMHETEKFWGKNAVAMEFAGKPFDATRFNASYNDKGYVLYAGRLSDEKGVEVLLHAMKELPDIKLKIAGVGDEAEKLKKLRDSLRLSNVEFLGALQGNEFRNVLEGARCLIVPSVWHENFPYVMMEAFATGKPVIGSDKGGIPEYIKHGETGFISPSGDPATLAAFIHRLFTEEGLAHNMGRKAKAFADENFTDEIFYLRLSAIYQKVAGKVGKKHEFSP